MKNAHTIDLFHFNLETGQQKPFIPLYYQTFGQPLGSAPVVIVQGDTTAYKAIDSNYFTVLVFKLPSIFSFTPRDTARIFWEGLLYLEIKDVFILGGKSLGPGVASEMTALHPTNVKDLLAANDSKNKRSGPNTALVLLKKDNREGQREIEYIPSAIPDAIKNSIEYVQD